MKEFIKRNLIAIVFWFPISILVIYLYVTNDDVPVMIPVHIGQVIADYPDQFKQYVDATISTAVTTDTNLVFTCNYIPAENENISLEVIKEIKASTELQNQTATFAILNAYHKHYCLGN